MLRIASSDKPPDRLQTVSQLSFHSWSQRHFCFLFEREIDNLFNLSFREKIIPIHIPAAVPRALPASEQTSWPSAPHALLATAHGGQGEKWSPSYPLGCGLRPESSPESRQAQAMFSMAKGESGKRHFPPCDTYVTLQVERQKETGGEA